jgi:hypothetical protein
VARVERIGADALPGPGRRRILSQPLVDPLDGAARQHLRKALDAAEEDRHDRAVALDHVDVEEPGHALTAHLEVEALPAGMRAAVIAKRDRYERAIRSLVAEGMKRGEFARGDPALVTRAMLGAVNWTARWYRPDGALSVAKIAEGLAEYLVKGLA